jgi:pseudo-response regulator 7
MGKDLSIGVRRNPDLKLEVPSDKSLGSEKAKFSDLDMKKDREKLEKELNEYNKTAKDEFQDKDNDLTGATTNTTNISFPQGGSAQNEVANDPSKIAHIKDLDQFDKKDLPSLQLSLKRLRDASNRGTNTQERNILRHSDHSAFSRYDHGS